MNYASINTELFCGIDLHAKEMYLCILNKLGKVIYHQNLSCGSDNLKAALSPYVGNISVGVESTYNWYWLGDACKSMHIPFYLGHALYMKAIQGSKNKSDKNDSKTIANLMRTQLFPLAYAYPENMRATRDLLRRRTYFVRLRAAAYTHIRNTFTQYGFAVSTLDVRRKSTRGDLTKAFKSDECVKLSIEQDIRTLDTYDSIVDEFEKRAVQHANYHNQAHYQLLQTIPGVGMVLALVMLYEIHTINRFASAQQFSSYCRLVRAQRESAGKTSKGGTAKAKIGNPYLKWAFSEIINTAQQYSAPIKDYYENLKKKFGLPRAKSIVAHRFGVATYYMLKSGKGFDAKIFISQNTGGDGEPGAQLDGQVRTKSLANAV